jgi:hypothetical protein
MSIGININNGTSPRSLSYNDGQVAVGGSDNQAGLYADGNDLFLDGTKIADRGQGNDGIVAKQDGLYYNGTKVGSGDAPTPPDPPTPPTPSEGLWIPPTQSASDLYAFNYRSGNGKRGFVDEYDALMTNSNYPGSIKKYEYLEQQVNTRVIRDTLTNTAHTVPVWQG